MWCALGNRDLFEQKYAASSQIKMDLKIPIESRLQFSFKQILEEHFGQKLRFKRLILKSILIRQCAIKRHKLWLPPLDRFRTCLKYSSLKRNVWGDF